MDYRKLLIYYLSSDEWAEEMDYFFEIWHHHWDPRQEVYTPNHIPNYVKSPVYLEFEKKLAAAGGSYYDLHLTDQQFRRFFDKRYSEGQRFAVLFGLWWGLSEPRIRRIADLRQKHNSSRWLNYFLCCPEASPDISVEELYKFRYDGKYLAEVYDHPAELARSQQPKLIPLEEVKTATI
ncbi:MAG: hypothetical protein IJX67_09000 [Oscillospiraceae bacterium]|nr:hypothetical protein [Oscillospiraceae bacterium]